MYIVVPFEKKPLQMNRKKLKYWLLPLGIIVVLLLSLNTILESVAKKYIQNKLQVEEGDARYTVAITDIGLNIYTQKLSLGGIQLQPGPSGITEPGSTAESDTLRSGGISLLSIDQATIHGVGLSNFLWNRNLAINEIILDSVNLVILKDPNATKEEENEKDKNARALKRRGLVIDSLKLPGIDQIRLGKFRVSHFGSLILDSQSGDTISGFQSSGIALQGMELDAVGPENSYTFVPVVEDLEIHLGSQEYLLASGLYGIKFSSLVYRQRGQHLRIDSVAFQPKMELDSFASRNRYSYDRYNASIASIDLKGLELTRFLRTGRIYVRSLSLDSLSADIFKDKTKPLDQSKIKPLFTQSLGKMQLPMKLDTVSITNSSLTYYERLPDTDKHVEVSFSNMNGTILNVHSATYALDAEKPLTLQLETDLLDAVNVGLKLEMSYDSDAFSMSGQTSGTSKLKALNPTVYPAMNMSFQGGRLDGIQFQARGTSRSMRGSLTMLYTDLEVELFKKDHSENKTLSWIANGLIKHSNPNKRGKVIVGEIAVERNLYKGTMNYVWKGVQSGVVNTFNPLGKRQRK